jgi:alkaline phosphatase
MPLPPTLARLAFAASVASLLILGGCNDDDEDAPAAPATPAVTSPVKNVILFIADGSQLEHEIAYSRYRYGTDNGVLGQSFPYKGWNTTWDVSLYNQWSWNAGREGVSAITAAAPDMATWNTYNANPSSPWKDMFPGPAMQFSEGYMLPMLGYDPNFGGTAPFPLGSPSEPAAERYQAIPQPDLYTTPGTPIIARWGTTGPSTNEYPGADSASTGTAMAAGRKTDDGNIAWLPGDPAGGQLKTIAEYAKAQGRAIGVVTSVPFSHATPATFVSHNVSRGNYHAISSEIINTVKPDVMIGAGHRSYDGTGYISSTDQDALAAGTTDYHFVQRTATVVGSTAIIAAADTVAANIVSGSGKKKLFGLFGTAAADGLTNPVANGYGNAAGAYAYSGYMTHYLPSGAVGGDGYGGFNWPLNENPTLAAATEAALKVLSKDNDGLFLMVEGGDIDWGNHPNDYEWNLGAWHNFDLACRKASDMVTAGTNGMTWDNTVIIIATDHGNSYMRLNKYYGKGVLPPAAERLMVKNSTAVPNLDANIGVRWSSTKHTNELVTLYAKGPEAALNKLRQYEGAWHQGTRILDNTHIFFAMCDMLGITPKANYDGSGSTLTPLVPATVATD